MSDVTPDPARLPMRADARRNRQRLIDATIALILEIGGEPTRDAVARRAKVGVATLYRHFPDQQELLRAVVVDVLDRTIAEGRAALSGSNSGGIALRRYLHAAIDTGLGVVNIVHPLLESTDWPDRRDAAQDVVRRLVDAAHADGAIADDVTANDVALTAIRFCRPLAIGLEPAEEHAIAHRQLDTHLDGLAAHPGIDRSTPGTTDRQQRLAPSANRSAVAPRIPSREVPQR